MSYRRDPFESMEQMFEQMRRAMFENLGDDWGNRALPAPGSPTYGASNFANTSIGIEERDGGYVVLADLPGFERDELELTVEGDVLTITGTHESEDDGDFRTRRVHESITLPADALVDDAEATYRNGVLEVMFPASSPSESVHRIDVE